MNIHVNTGARKLGLAATAALAFGLVTIGPAAAATSSASVANDTLTVTGAQGADRLALRLAAGDPNSLQVDFGDNGSADRSFDRATFSHIRVSLGGGNDRFRVDEANGAIADEGLVVFAGSGSDTIAGSGGSDIVVGGSGDDSVDGRRGNDTALLGSGRDDFTWLPGDGSDDIEGGAGLDKLIFDGSGANEVMSLSANGDRTVFLRDVGAIRMDMNDVEVLDLAAAGGADTITVDDMTGTGFRKAYVDLGSQGVADGAADVVTLNGSGRDDDLRATATRRQVDAQASSVVARISGSETSDRLQLNGRGGDDSLRIGRGVTRLIGVAIDLGAGQP
jgi:Ca2+-binding RTX toxin-like protein